MKNHTLNYKEIVFIFYYPDKFYNARKGAEKKLQIVMQESVI